MPDIHIQRDHPLGLARAREIAGEWLEQARTTYGMECSCDAGEAEDVIRFSRPGVSGTLLLSGSEFVLDAKLGFLLGAFKDRIEEQVAANLDALLSRGESP